MRKTAASSRMTLSLSPLYLQEKLKSLKENRWIDRNTVSMQAERDRERSRDRDRETANREIDSDRQRFSPGGPSIPSYLQAAPRDYRILFRHKAPRPAAAPLLSTPAFTPLVHLLSRRQLQTPDGTDSQTHRRTDAQTHRPQPHLSIRRMGVVDRVRC
jgi:hypothetical protein